MSHTDTSEYEQLAVASGSGVRARYQPLSPVVVLTTTTITALVGGALLVLAAKWSSPLVGLLGVVVATGAAWITTDYTAAKWRVDRSGAWKAFVVGAALLGFIGLWLADTLRSSLGSLAPALGFLSLMALTLAIGPVVGEMRDGAVNDADRWMRKGLLAGFASAIVIGSPVPNWLRLLAVLSLLGGFGFFTGGLSTMCAHDALPRSRVLMIVPGDARQRGIVVGGTGLGILLLGVLTRLAPVCTVGAWLTVVAMIMLSVRPARFGMSRLMERAVLGAGLLLVAVAGYQLYATDTVGRSGWFATFLALTIALVGAWIVWRGSTLFIVVVLGFAFVWGLFPHTTSDHDQVSATATGDTRTAGIVAFGDSFISGEGATEYYPGTDQKGAERNECRRAPTAYPALIADRVGVTSNDDTTPPDLLAVDALTEPGLDFYACSGAKLGDVLVLCDNNPAVVLLKAAARASKGDVEGEEPDPAALDAAVAEGAEDQECVRVAEARNDLRRQKFPCAEDVEGLLGQYPCTVADVHGATLQVENLPEDRGATQLVLLSIGGNDVRFGDIVAGCLLPGSCAERREVWLDNVSALGPELTEAYVNIKDEFKNEVPIVVMPYPLVLTEQTCDSSPLDASEHEFVYEFTTVLNSQMAASAQQAGVHFFDEGAFALQGQRLCESGQRAINLIRLQPTDGPLSKRLNPGSWTHNSMHPNRRGHEMIAEELAAWLDREGIIGAGNPDEMDVRDARLLDVRTARPHAVPPLVARDLRSSAPEACDVSPIGSFATRIAVFDEQPASATDVEAFRVPVVGADPEATLCVTDSSGKWMSLIPKPEEDSIGMMQSPSADPVAEIRGESVFVTGGRPGDSCESDFTEEQCDFQWVLFSTPQVGATAPTWSLRAVRYCSVDPTCENTFDDWRDAQIDRAVRRVAPTTGLIFLGGWLLALGVELVFAQRLAARLRPKLIGSIARPADPAR